MASKETVYYDGSTIVEADRILGSMNILLLLYWSSRTSTVVHGITRGEGVGRQMPPLVQRLVCIVCVQYSVSAYRLFSCIISHEQLGSVQRLYRAGAGGTSSYVYQ